MNGDMWDQPPRPRPHTWNPWVFAADVIAWAFIAGGLAWWLGH